MSINRTEHRSHLIHLKNKW